MLPPVLASANQLTTATEARQRPDQTSTIRPTVIPQPTSPTRIDQNSAIAGQLNIMLLSGPERMSQNLAALADVLGSALKIEQQINESLNDYMGRLIEGIAALPAGDRVKLQKLLSQAFAGLQLRTLLEAMASPSGPERATLALYLELYRQKDGDGATRSVISSYRELAAEGRPNAPGQSRPTAANDSAGPSPEPGRPTLKSAAPAPLASSAALSAGQSPAEGRSSPTVSVSNNAGATAPIRPQASEMATEGVLDPVRQMTGSASARSNVQVAVTAGREGLSPSASSGGTLGPSNVTETAAQASTRSTGLRMPDATNSDAGPDRATVAAALAQAITSAPKPMMPEAATAGWLAELLETDFVRSLLQLKSLPVDLFKSATNSGARDPQASNALLPDPAAAPNSGAIDEAEPASQMFDANGTRLPADADPQPTALPLAEQTASRSVMMREGVPLPFVSYMIESDIPSEEVEEQDDRDAEDEDQSHGDDAADGEPSTEEPADKPAGSFVAEDLREQAADRLALVTPGDDDLTRKAALPAPMGAALPLPPEPAHELYLRMSGLS